MAEFKFFCPQCKQQIQCDATYAGSQISCPVCQQTIIVPPVPPASVAAGGRTLQIKMSTLRKAAIIGGVCLLLAAAFYFFTFVTFGQTLAGDWTYNGQPCQIKQKGQHLTFINERGEKSEGSFKTETTVVATDWSGLIGNLSKDKKIIRWRNGTVWMRAK
jgi:DNA-directed RNA polymerase subunit RPC12/RpoP